MRDLKRREGREQAQNDAWTGGTECKEENRHRRKGGENRETESKEKEQTQYEEWTRNLAFGLIGTAHPSQYKSSTPTPLSSYAGHDAVLGLFSTAFDLCGYNARSRKY
jgi:hypothetical protein